MAEIDEYREAEAKEAEKGADTATENGITLDTNTMVAQGDTMPDSGTMIPAKPKKGGTGKVEEEEDEGPDIDDDDAPDFGTMVKVKDKKDDKKGGEADYMKSIKGAESKQAQAAMGGGAGAGPKPPASAPPPSALAIQRPGAGAPAVGGAAVPLAAASVKPLEQNGAKATPAANPTAGAGGASTPGGSGDKKEFQQYYKTGKQLEVSATSSLMELRQQLINLNNAYDEELNALEKFYADKRKALQQLIHTKEKEEAAQKAAKKR